MKKIIIESSSEVSHSLLTIKLVESGIHFTERILNDSSFPQITWTAYAEVIIDAEQQLAITELLAQVPTEDYRVKVIDISGQKGKYIKLGIIIYAIVMTLLFVKYWHRDYQNREDKNFTFTWNHSNTSLFQSDKTSGKIVTRYEDINYDNNYERMELYALGGDPVGVYLDKNENGFYEEAYFFDFAGHSTGMAKDHNSDGMFDYYELITQENDTLIFEDRNGKGRYSWINKQDVR
ncbi:MAG: hypothetical protein AAFO69_17005 [Bacteroidota bacterium]